jgi:hypothetical protein
LSGVEVSHVVQADFAQLAPDRSATLTFPTTTSVKVTVSGAGYSTNAYDQIPAMTAVAETVQPGVSDPELQWLQTGAGVSLTATTSGGVTTWTGVVNLPAARGSQPMRILVAESEQYPQLESGDATERVTYFDAIEL